MVLFAEKIEEETDAEYKKKLGVVTTFEAKVLELLKEISAKLDVKI